MVQSSDDCFAFGGDSLSVAGALELLRAKVNAVATPETVTIKDALGRVLAGPLVATRQVPPHDNAAVDGFAVFFDDLAPGAETRLPVTARSAAGHPLARAAKRGEAIRIFTGAPVPIGPDTVLVQEDCVVENGTVRIPPGIARGANLRHAGEDVEAGAVVLPPGRRLRAQELGLAAALGLTEISVYRRLRVALFSTGDEVYEPGTAAPPGGIYDANRYTLYGLLDALGCRISDLGILPDRSEAIGEALQGAVANHDLILTSGGMSVGEEDHLKKSVEQLGRLHFWRLGIKPGRPVGMGQVGRVPFIGLPGNPVAAMVTFLLLARPLVLRLQGAEETEPRRYRVIAGFDHKKRPNRREFLRARLVRGEDGDWVAHKFPREGVGILTSMVESDGLVELAEDVLRVEPGSPVQFLPFAEVTN